MVGAPGPCPLGGETPDDALVQAEELSGRIRHAARFLRSLVAYEPHPLLGRLTTLQTAVLQAVAEDGGLRIGVLAHRFGVAHSTIADLVARLEKRGLVVRMPDEKDHRSVQIVPTWKVRRLLGGRAKREIHLPMARILAHATPEERVQILAGFRVLERLFGEHNIRRYRAGQRTIGAP